MSTGEYVRHVENSRLAVLMIHGIMGGPSYFRPFVPLVPTDCSVYNICLEGHCGTVKDFCRASMKKWKAQVFSLLEELLTRHEKVMIVGYSLGALLGAEAAERYPDRICHLVCFSFPLIMRLPPAANIQVWRIVWGKVKPGTPTERMAAACAVEHTRKFWHYWGTYPRLLELAVEMYRARKRLRHLTVPCHGYQGALDEMLSPRNNRFLEKFPNVTNTVLPCSGHFRFEPEDLPRVQKDFTHLLEQYR